MSPESPVLPTVHGFSASGNCHKVRLLLEQLGRRYRWIEVDSSKGQTRTPEFLARNPNGRVPNSEHYQYKLSWLAALRDMVAAGQFPSGGR